MFAYLRNFRDDLLQSRSFVYWYCKNFHKDHIILVREDLPLGMT